MVKVVGVIAGFCLIIFLTVFFILCRIIEDEDEESEIEDEGKIETIQPPPIRTNENLMKIKMEEDYHPIFIPKEEPVEEERTVTRQSDEGVSRNTNKICLCEGVDGKFSILIKLYLNVYL